MTEIPHAVVRQLVQSVLADLMSTSAINHPGENGRAREQIVRRYLRTVVPAGFGVDTGFVVDAHGSVSRQIDIVIYRDGYHPVFDVGGVKHFMIESVVAVIENKARIESADVLRSALANVRSVKTLDRTGGGRNYIVRDWENRGPKVADDPYRHSVWTGVIAQKSLTLDHFTQVITEDLKAHDRTQWLDCYCALHDFASLYLSSAPDGTRTHRRVIDTSVTSLGVMPTETGESPLVEMTRLLVDRLRYSPTIDYDPGKYFPSAMRSRPIVTLDFSSTTPSSPPGEPTDSA